MTRTLDENGLIVGRADAIYTFSGKTIRPLEPDPADIDIIDVAHALSQQPRFTGHLRRFYSVAEHSLRASYAVEIEDGTTMQQLEALLHDASEAYLSDISRPVKKAPPFAFYLEVEAKLERAIQERFGLPVGPMPSYVKRADERMLGIEIRALAHPTFQEAYGVVEPWPLLLEPLCLPPRAAEERFLERFDDLYDAVQS